MDEGAWIPGSIPARRSRGRLAPRAFTAVLWAALATALGAAGTPAGDPPSQPGPPAAFQEILADPRIAEALVWDGAWKAGAGPRAYPRWDPQRRAELHRVLGTADPGEAAPADAQGPERDTAWGRYLAQVAHALRVEAHRQVPWSLRSLTPEQLALLLDGRLLETPGPEAEPGPEPASSGWFSATGPATPEPAAALDFLQEHDLVAASQEETVFAFAEWVRHTVRRPPGASTPDCAELSRLFAVAMRSVNIPVRITASRFARPGAPPSLHSRVELPTLGRGLTHSADLFAPLAIPSGNAIPTAALFPTLGWIRDHVDHPRNVDCEDEICQTDPEQALYNAARRLLALAAIHLPDGLLIDRAVDPAASEPPRRLLETLAAGCPGHDGDDFVRPLFEEAERREIARRADEEIERAGGGDWGRGAAAIRRRWETALGNR